MLIRDYKTTDLKFTPYNPFIHALAEIRDFYKYEGESVVQEIHIVGEYKRGHRLSDGSWSLTPAKDGSSIPQKFLIVRIEQRERTINLPEQRVKITHIFSDGRAI